MRMVFVLAPGGEEACGFIPSFLCEDDPRKAREQFSEHYAGGWHPMDGFFMDEDMNIQYPGDPPHKPMASMTLRDEMIVVYHHGWVAIIQPDNSYEIARMD